MTSNSEILDHGGYIDPGATTKEAFEISKKSRMLARQKIGNNNPEDRIRQRCSIAVGDFSMAELLRFVNNPVNATLSALKKSSPIITDIRMTQMGIQKKGHSSEIFCALDFGIDLATGEEITRSSAGFIALKEKISDAIIVIGNAPSALLSVCSLVKKDVCPVVIIGTPVGFVNAAESKEELRMLNLPSISTEGTRGGTPVAVAALNECITMLIEESE